jgi:peptidoglycan/LPS O-acetylase OafA/YrhL
VTDVAKQIKGFRPDIQALRALAVGGVVVFHLYPGLLTGGFTGVDVFFVISGFLITSHLVGRPPTTGRDLLTFWGRRIRRLLPASLLVLAATLLAAWVVAPASVLPDTARMARAAATYWINWLLAADSIDYLRAEDPPSAVQHFWSLSVEEQFYAGWPILLLALVWLARRTRVPLPVAIMGGLGAVVAVSFALSVHLTQANPPAAYFVTHTRIWELGVGALLGAWVTLRPDWRPPGGPRLVPVWAWLGIAAMAFAFLTYDETTPFPGWQAAVPVLGAALVLAARPDSGLLGAVARWRPVQWVGDVSYSVYLWHWPLIILTPFVSGGSLGLLDKLAIVVATLVLAGLTKRWVEDPARFFRPRAPLRWTYLAGATGMAVVVGIALSQITAANHAIAAAEKKKEQALAEAQEDPESCIGAAALGRADCPAPSLDRVVLAPMVARADKPKTHPEVPGGKHCPGQEQNDFELVVCEFGNPDADRTIALVGDSHAQHLLPAVEGVAASLDLRVITHVSSGCNFAGVRQEGPTPAWTDGCERWAAGTLDLLLQERPDVVAISNRTFRTVEGFPDVPASVDSYTEAATEVTRTLVDAGIKVLIIRDTPTPNQSVPLCLDEGPATLAECGGTPKQWVRLDAWLPVAKALGSPAVRVVNLNDRICTETECPPIIGDLIAYYDSSHLTASFSATLAPYLEPAVRELLAVP